MVLSLALSAFSQADAAKLTFKITDPSETDKVILTFAQSNEQKEITIDAAGNGSIEITDFAPQYVTMQYTRGRRTLYLDPSQDLTLSFKSNEMWNNVNFEGAGAAINTYLGSRKLKSLGMPDMKMQEDAIIHRGDSLFAANCQILEAAQLPAAFTAIEKVRLQYYTYYYFPLYATYHRMYGDDKSYIPSETFYTKVKALTTIDAKLLALREYKAYLPGAISALSNEGEKVNSNSPEQLMNYIDTKIKDAAVAEFLVDEFVYKYVDNSGLDNADPLIAMFRKHVKDAQSIEKFNKLCAQWEKLRSGNPSVGFSYSDIDGKTVSLADLKGKFIYIDVWATWCGPCRGELPALKGLEEKYAGKDIHFVSMSCDKDKKAWETMVKKDELKGIQLHMGTDRSFMDAYLIKSIPRFILLDRDGNIISADMSRPSDARTAKKFDELLGL